MISRDDERKRRKFLLFIFLLLVLTWDIDMCERPSVWDERYKKEVKRTTFSQSTFDLYSHACAHRQDVRWNTLNTIPDECLLAFFFSELFCFLDSIRTYDTKKKKNVSKSTIAKSEHWRKKTEVASKTRKKIVKKRNTTKRETTEFIVVFHNLLIRLCLFCCWFFLSFCTCSI